MKVIKWLDAYIEEVLLIILTSLMVSVIFIQVVMRVLGNSLTWSEELARFSFIWLVYIGISYGVKKMKHISIDVVQIAMKGRAQLILPIVSNIFFIIFSLFVIYYGYNISVTLLGYGQSTPALGLPMGVIYLATPVGFGLTLIRLIQNLIRQIKDFKNYDESKGIRKENTYEGSIL